MRKAWLILQKDIQQEFKTRFAVNAILLFAVVTLTAVSFSIGTYSASQEILAALLWIILFFSAMSGLSHIFVREEETHTADTLKLVALPVNVFWGKFFFNLILLILVEIIIIPLYFAVMNFVVIHTSFFILVMLLGSLGLTGGGTMVAAIISKASAKGALFTVLSFPILLPVLVSAISATNSAVGNDPVSLTGNAIQTMIAYDVVIITASVLLFDFVWNE
ncbi:MAG: ABC transporter permease [Caldithrix sp.]|nr:ABC transporter permease [Caldithrix sp.]